MQPSFIMTKSIEEFEYFSPATLEEALTFLHKHGEDINILAGGTDLLLDLKFRTRAPKFIMDNTKIPEMGFIRRTSGGGLRIGALTTMTQIRESEIIKQEYQSLHESTTDAFHSWQIKNMATIGGNICRSSPAADTVPPLLTYEAEVNLFGPKGERKVLLEDFMIGPGQNILEQEILTAIIIPPQKEPYGTAFHSLKRTSVDLCKVNCAVKIMIVNNKFDEVKIALGSVAPTAVRAKKAEAALNGREVSDESIEDSARKIADDISPITDGRSTAEYRREVSGVIVRRLLKKAVKRAKTL